MSTQSETRLSMDGKSTLMGPRKDSYIYDKCRYCVSVFKWLPVVFISAVLCWGYYAYVWQLCIETMTSVILKSICLLVFHFLFMMTFWSYGRTIFVSPGGVPKNFWFTVEEFEALDKETTEEGKSRIIAQIVSNRQLPVMCRTYLGGFRTCEKCNLIKPDRAHHCSVCGYCVLKMDHHCPWVNNCVSFSNYKYFVLFLGYAFTLCLFAASTSFYYFVKSWKNELPTWGKFHILFLFFVAIMFAISLVSLFGYHVYLILVNRSTLESFRSPIFRFGPDKAAFSLGKYENWCQVFGRSKSKWFFPVDTSLGDGIIYPTNSKHRAQEQESNTRQQAAFKPLLHPDTEQGADQQAIMTTSKQSHRNFYNSFPPPGGCKVTPGAIPQNVCIQMPVDNPSSNPPGPPANARVDGVAMMGGDKTEPAFL